MLNSLFSLQFVWIALLITILSILLALLCAFLLNLLLTFAPGEWLLEHAYCPLAKALLLLFMAFLLFPLIVKSSSYSELAGLFMQADSVINMLNILFVSSLLLSFLPGLSHPALALPLLGCISIGLIFMHQVAIPLLPEVSWIPSFAASFGIVALIVLSHLLTRWLTPRISGWADYHFNIADSKTLISDINYLILQMPILLAYGHSLQSQAVERL